jgi:hypothetical protein
VSEIPFEWFVDLVDGKWLINHNGRYTGPYSSRDEAVHAAIHAAQQAGAADPRGAVVMIREEGRLFRTLWTYRGDRQPRQA